MKKYNLYKAAVTLVLLTVSLLLLSNVRTETAYLRTTVIEIDGKSYILDTYEINKAAHFKLRDIAYLLNLTGKQADITWDSVNNLIEIAAGKPYRETGSEMMISGKENKKVVQVSVVLKAAGDIYEEPSYLISGNYYFTMETIASLFGVTAEKGTASYRIKIMEGAQLKETSDMGQEYIDSFIFLGDSTTNGLQAYGILSGGKQTAQVWVPANKTFSLFNQRGIRIVYPVTGKELLVEEAVREQKPEFMLITLGVNGVASMDEESFKLHYRELINRIGESCVDTKIILNTIYPVAKNYSNLDKINNDKINRANKWIAELAEEAGVKYIDTNSILKDSEGWLAVKNQNGDGLHLSPAAYKEIISYVRTHGYR